MKNKEIIFGILLTAAGFIGGYFWGKIPDYPIVSLVILAYAVIYGFFLIFTENLWLRWGVPILSLMLFAVSLGQSKFTLSGLLLALAILLYSVWDSEREYNASVAFSSKKIVGKSLKMFFTSLAVVVAFSYYGSIFEQSSASLLLPENIFHGIFKFLEVPLQKYFPGITADSKIEDVAISEQIEQFSAELGISIKGDENVSRALYKLSIAKLNEYTGPYRFYIPVIAAASYFLALKFVSIIFMYGALLFMFLFIKIFTVAGLFVKTKIPASREILV
ncbi:hypothetical protein HYT01_02285 [Candidatus Giovannonibacteria bacterium]|nr:hypothetical protein [Candidatus Giovannonibacteria bacterium]